MKKIFICFTASLALLSSLAMAKTEGNSIQLNLIQTTVEFSEGVSVEGDDIGFGVAAKHAINLGNNFYIAPGAFYDHNNTEITIDNNNKGSLDYSYGAGLDIGYDLNNQLSIFANVAWVEGRITAETNGIESSVDSEEDYYYGLGLKYAIDKQLSASLAYNTAEIDENLDISTIKLGVAYNF